jgi:DNA-binding transcriptional LysR family regulator
MLEALETFLAVASSGSFSRTAKSEGVAVSSVARRMAQLETEFGATLFNRTSREVMLTDAGHHLLPRARSILAELANAKESLAALDVEPRGLLSVTAPAMFGRRHVVPAVIEFMRTYPLIQIELLLSDDALDLSRRRVDVALRIGTRPSSDLVATQLAPIRRWVCASPEYLERRGRPHAPLDLLAHDCLTVASTPIPVGWWCFEGVNRGLPLAVSGSLRSDDTGALLQAALAGVGIVHLASWLVSEHLATGRLVSLFPTLEPPRKAATVLQAIRMPGRSHAARARLLISHLRAVFGAPPYWDRVIGA